MELAFEVNEKGTREKNDGNESMIIADNEKIEVGSDNGSFVEEDWNKPEQDEVPKWTGADLPMTTESRKGGRKKTGMRYNRYGDGFLSNKIQPGELGEEMVNMTDLVADEEWQIINDIEHSRQEDHTRQEKEVDLKQSEIEKRDSRVDTWSAG